MFVFAAKCKKPGKRGKTQYGEQVSACFVHPDPKKGDIWVNTKKVDSDEATGLMNLKDGKSYPLVWVEAGDKSHFKVAKFHPSLSEMFSGPPSGIPSDTGNHIESKAEVLNRCRLKMRALLYPKEGTLTTEQETIVQKYAATLFINLKD